MAKQRTTQKLVSINYKKWGIIAAAIASTLVLLKFAVEGIDAHIENIAEDMVRKRMEQYPSSEDLKRMSMDIEKIKGDVADTKSKVNGIDEYLRGAKIRP